MKIPESTHEALSRQIKENNWAKILDTLPDGIMILDNHHRVVHVNRAMARLKGLDPGLMVNKYCYEIVHGTSYPLECCPHSKLMADGCEHHAEVHEHLLGGYCMVSVSPICCPEDRLIGSIHVMRDINASKLAQEAIKRSEEKYRLLTENAKEMILSVNMEAIITYANRAALEISGYSSKEVIGRSLIDIIPQDQLELYEQLKQERLSGNKEMFFYETAFKNKKGDIVPVEVSSGPLTKHDQPCGVLISARDITQRNLIEDEFRNGNIKIICSTPTLAAGVDLPAFRTIIRDLKRFSYRGLIWIPVLEYLQMAGRAGRPEYEKFGEAIVIAKSQTEKEEIYENTLVIELKKSNLSVEQQKAITVFYEGVVVGQYFADVVVADTVVVELKAAESLCESHRAQLQNYLRSTRHEVGLLLNFGKDPEFERIFFTNDRKRPGPSVHKEPLSNP